LITFDLQLTLADIVIIEILSKFSTLCEPDLLGAFPSLDAHRDRIESMPELKDYLNQRARTFF
jgi:hypothetical protein